ncbi:T9SS type A sorting domain-containing protein [Flavisolibacter tropicus]|uniref:T9SS type A sorting domain-containing protein n=1 Tax=Flavisolibacter tropicus TaxID=1492898 RepID=UPI0008336A7D|nr:T9SS type A sorting domain-containing protein [Flavisolibacter tropicus]
MKQHYLKASFFFLFLLAIKTGFTQTGPGGVGTTDGTSSLKVWLRADKNAYTNAGVTAAANGQAVQQWNDQSGSNLYARQTDAVALKPTYKASFSNGQPALSFANNQLVVPFDISPAVTPNFTVFAVASHKTALRVKSKLFGHDNGGYDRTIGFDDRATKKFTYFSGSSVGDFSDQPVANTPFLITANYTTTTFSGWMNGAQEVSGASVSNGAGVNYFGIGNLTGTAGSGAEYWNGDIAEFILFNRSVTKAERILVENYLSAKYGTTLSADDFYTKDNNGYDFDVTGIGQADDNSQVTSAVGAGIIKISMDNPSGLAAGSNFLFIGHNNGSLAADAADIPTGLVKRMNRTWAVSETGEVGTVTLSIDLGDQPVASAADLRLLIDTDNDGVFSDETDGVGVIGGAIQSGTVYTFNSVNLADGTLFTIGSTTPVTLPLTLTSFELIKGSTNQLVWRTASEQNTAFFEVQRSTDGRNFNTIGKVDAAGNSTYERSYSFTDAANVQGKIYYRLKMVDVDNKFEYSAVVSASNDAATYTLRLAPNPVVNNIVISGLKNGTSFIRVLNANGEVVAQQQTTKTRTEIDFTKQPAGSYFIQVTNNNKVLTEKIIKK